ncbi:pre-rRNA-processing protein TSR2 homolog [Littorina saxatilis]|uniref:Pre-rRNA-processing protein TSR2 homolog n=1 Tax=Littorina saxatilis TaxID=31220 RepID=A0AAN9BAE4_9CAEN
MAASSQPTLFNQAVSRILSSWGGLQIAIDHGLGGANSRQKALDFVDDIEDVFKRHGNIDPYDFAGLLEDEVDERFNTLLEDGSAQAIAHHICQSFMLLRDGRTAEVGKFLEGLPGATQQKAQCAGGDDSSDDEDDDGEDAGSAKTQQPQQQPSQNGQCSSDGASTSGASPMVNGGGDAGMDVDEEDDGWTTVKKGGKNSRKR